MDSYPYKLSSKKKAELFEITDKQDKAFLLTNIHNKNNYKFSRRLVIVAVRNARGKVYICQKKTKNDYGEWCIPSMGYVLAGEAKEDAATRLLKESLAISVNKLTEVTSIPYENEEGVHLHLSFFMAGPIAEVIQFNKEEFLTGMFVNSNELKAVIEHIPEAISPMLLWSSRARLF